MMSVLKRVRLRTGYDSAIRVGLGVLGCLGDALVSAAPLESRLFSALATLAAPSSASVFASSSALRCSSRAFFVG